MTLPLLLSSILHDGCTNLCGWLAALFAVVSFGSFGVPIKLMCHVETHPLILQSYKTLVCFVTCWLVLLFGIPYHFSYWGIASGLFWVPGATCGVYAIQNAGLAISVGTWSSLIVLSSSIFGILMFNETFASLYETFFAFCFLITGLIGMSKYSAPQSSSSSQHQQQQSQSYYPLATDEQHVANDTTTTSSSFTSNSPQLLRKPKLGHKKKNKGVNTSSNSNTGESNDNHISKLRLAPLEIDHDPDTNGGPTKNNDNDDDESFLVDIPMDRGDGDDDSDEYDSNGNADVDNTNDRSSNNKDKKKDSIIILWGGRIALTRRQVGIMGAVINGAWGGMNLVPLHFAMKNEGITGAGYIISYATGSFIVNVLIWVVFFLYYLFFHTKGRYDIKEALILLPKWKKELVLPGIACGLLYSCGNFGSIIAVSFLGQGLGYSLCQMQLFISGLWGILYFHEIRGTDNIVKWFLSALVAFIGIIGISYEHQGSSSSH